jgi:hypothetical protein
VAPQLAGSSEQGTLSVKRVSPALKRQVTSLLEQMGAAFPSQKFEEATAVMYQRATEMLVEVFSLPRV